MVLHTHQRLYDLMTISWEMVRTRFRKCSCSRQQESVVTTVIYIYPSPWCFLQRWIARQACTRQCKRCEERLTKMVFQLLRITCLNIVDVRVADTISNRFLKWVTHPECPRNTVYREIVCKSGLSVHGCNFSFAKPDREVGVFSDCTLSACVNYFQLLLLWIVLFRVCVCVKFCLPKLWYHHVCPA